MNVHCVAFILASPAEIQDGSAFREAARFCAWDATVVIRCEATGRELQASCPRGNGDPVARFEREWARKFVT